MFDSVGTVGLYSFGYQISEIINALLVSPLKEGIMPYIYKMEKDPEGQRAVIRSTAIYFYVFGIFCALGFSLYARELVMLLARREEFWPVWEIIPIISLCYILHGLGNFLSLGILMKNKTFHLSAILIVSAIFNLGLNFLLIPVLGLFGAAMATLVSYIIWNALKSYYSHKFYQLSFDYRRLWQITIIGVVLYLISLNIAITDLIYLNILIKALILITYPLLFVIIPFFTADEKIVIRRFWVSVKKASLFKAD